MRGGETRLKAMAGRDRHSAGAARQGGGGVGDTGGRVREPHVAQGSGAASVAPHLEVGLPGRIGRNVQLALEVALAQFEEARKLGRHPVGHVLDEQHDRWR